jgi:hypothetical protein
MQSNSWQRKYFTVRTCLDLRRTCSTTQSRILKVCPMPLHASHSQVTTHPHVQVRAPQFSSDPTVRGWLCTIWSCEWEGCVLSTRNKDPATWLTSWQINRLCTGEIPTTQKSELEAYTWNFCFQWNPIFHYNPPLSLVLLDICMTVGIDLWLVVGQKLCPSLECYTVFNQWTKDHSSTPSDRK